MPNADFQNLTITVAARQDACYPTTVRGPGGDARGSMQLPTSDANIQQIIARLRRLDTDADALAQLGTALFGTLFSGAAAGVYARSQGALAPGQSLRLVLDIAAEEADVIALPWEFICEPGQQALALRGMPVVRYLPQPKIIPTLRTTLPLRVLLTAAQTPPVPAVEQELATIRTELAKLGGLVDVVVEEHLTKAKLQDRLREEFHIWHFLGHGGFSRTGEGRLLLEDAEGQPDPLSASGLGVLLAGSGVRLVVLNACLGAQVGADPLRSLAPQIIQADIPAVIAMQFSVPEETARVFASEFYQSLAEGFPIDACLAEGRRAVAGASGPQSADWGIPVLYTRAADGRLFDLPVAPKPRCPYPGMVPFRPDDARFFYGRAQEIGEMLRRIRVQRRLLVIGPSGSGKSSLVRAGFLPQLRESTLFPPGTWRISEFRPGAHPLARLAEALAAPTEAPPEGQRLLLFIDQMEELFTVASRDESGAFIAQLRELVASERITLLLAMRADFFPDLMSSALWPLEASERIEVAPLRGEALREAIEHPAQDVGVRLEPGLVDRLLADASDEPGVLPLIQETMVLLWDRMPFRLLTTTTYTDLGRDGQSGLAVAIATRADATLAALAQDQRPIAQRILLRLVQFGEGRSDTRRQQPIDALRVASEDSALFDTTLRALVDSRLLTITSEAGQAQTSPLCDISHEALIRGWPTIQGWITTRRESELTRRRLEAKATDWVRLGRKEDGGLLDAYELPEARRWLEGSDAEELGYSDDLRDLILYSNAAIETAQLERDQTHQRELAQAQVLLDEQAARADAERQRAEEQQRSAFELRKRARNLRIALAGTLLLLALTAYLGVATQKSELAAREARGRAQAAAEQSQQRAREQRNQSLIDAGWLALARGETDTALALAYAAATKIDPPPNGAAQLLYEAAYAPGTLHRLSGHTSAVAALAIDPSGTIAYSAAWDKTLRIWNLRTGQQIGMLGQHAAPINCIALNQAGTLLASGADDGVIQFWDPEQHTLLGHVDLGSANTPVYSIALTPDSAYLVAAYKDNAVRIWDVRQRKLVHTLSGHTKRVWGVAVSPNGKLIASASEDGTVKLWDLARVTSVADRDADLVPLRTYTPETGPIYVLAFSPDNTRIAFAGLSPKVQIWSADDLRLMAELDGHTDYLLGVTFSADGRRIASISADASIRVWDATSGRELRRFLGHIGPIYAAVFTPDGNAIVSGGNDATIRQWELESGALQEKIELGSAVLGVSLLPGGAQALVGAEDGDMHLLDLGTSTVLGRNPGHTGRVYQVAISDDGSLAVSCSRDGTLRVWDLTTGQTLHVLKGHTDRVITVALSPQRWLAVSGSADMSLRIWDLVSGRQIGELQGHTAAVNIVALSPDGRTVASGARDNTLRLWDVATRRQIQKLEGFGGEVAGLAFSPDGSKIYAASYDKTIRVWNVATGQPETQVFIGHIGPVLGIAISPDGRYLASASSDMTIRLWDTATGAELQQLVGHTNAVSAVAFLPHGHQLISASMDGSVRVWRLDNLDNLLAWVRENRYIRPLNERERSSFSIPGSLIE